MVRSVLLFIVFFTSLEITSQIPRCDFESQKIFSQSLNFKESAFHRQEFIDISLVFHIVYQNEEQNISEEKILEQISILNNDFQGIHLNKSIINANDLGRIGVSNLRFKLANVDEFGNNTNGISRKKTAIDNIGDLEDSQGNLIVKQESLGGIDPWDNSKYINIWVCHRTISIGTTKGLKEENNIFEGIVINFDQIGTQTEGPYNLGKSFTHEMGHYLGLLHPWGNTTGCDNEGDFIDDTPFQSRPLFDCRSVLECGVIINPGNLMDFGADECLNYFTKGQVEKMHYTITDIRPSLIGSNDNFISNLPENKNLIISSSPDEIHIYNNSVNPVTKIQLFSSAGQLITTIVNKSEYYLNIQTYGIPAGIYLLAIERGKELMTRKIFIY